MTQIFHVVELTENSWFSAWLTWARIKKCNPAALLEFVYFTGVKQLFCRSCDARKKYEGKNVFLEVDFKARCSSLGLGVVSKSVPPLICFPLNTWTWDSSKTSLLYTGSVSNTIWQDNRTRQIDAQQHQSCQNKNNSNIPDQPLTQYMHM